MGVQGLHLVDEVLAENLVTVAQQITRRTVPRKGLTKLLGCPLCSWMSRHAEVENASPVVRQHQKYVQDLEPDRWHREKVHGHQAAQVIVQKGPPSL